MKAQRDPGVPPALQFLEYVHERWGLLGGDGGFGAHAFESLSAGSWEEPGPRKSSAPSKDPTAVLPPNLGRGITRLFDDRRL